MAFACDFSARAVTCAPKSRKQRPFLAVPVLPPGRTGRQTHPTLCPFLARAVTCALEKDRGSGVFGCFVRRQCPSDILGEGALPPPPDPHPQRVFMDNGLAGLPKLEGQGLSELSFLRARQICPMWGKSVVPSENSLRQALPFKFWELNRFPVPLVVTRGTRRPGGSPVCQFSGRVEELYAPSLARPYRPCLGRSGAENKERGRIAGHGPTGRASLELASLAEENCYQDRRFARQFLRPRGRKNSFRIARDGATPRPRSSSLALAIINMVDLIYFWS